MIQRRVTIAANDRVAERTFRVRFACPELAPLLRPGQFLMVRLPDATDPLLGRPFAFYDIGGDSVDVVYLVLGKMTGRLSTLPAGTPLEVWGPLGKPFPTLTGEPRVTLVAGGIGQTPFLAYARQLLAQGSSVSMFYGARSADYFVGLDDFRATGVDPKLATDDGSAGHHGRVTELVRADPHSGPVVGCGPEPMLRALAETCAQLGRPCWVSLETPMACGTGLCFSCVTAVKLPEGGCDYKRVCVEGPTFAAETLAWDRRP